MILINGHSLFLRLFQPGMNIFCITAYRHIPDRGKRKATFLASRLSGTTSFIHNHLPGGMILTSGLKKKK
jgi:hypothetical protein